MVGGRREPKTKNIENKILPLKTKSKIRPMGWKMGIWKYLLRRSNLVKYVLFEKFLDKLENIEMLNFRPARNKLIEPTKVVN